MFAKIKQIHCKRTGAPNDKDRANLARLEQAESDLGVLKARASRAIGILDARDGRNHWRESIEQMIQGSA